MQNTPYAMSTFFFLLPVRCIFSLTVGWHLSIKLMLRCLKFQQLVDNLDRDLQYAVSVEGKMDLETISNYDEVKDTIMEKVCSGKLINISVMASSIELIYIFIMPLYFRDI